VAGQVADRIGSSQILQAGHADGGEPGGGCAGTGFALGGTVAQVLAGAG